MNLWPEERSPLGEAFRGAEDALNPPQPATGPCLGEKLALSLLEAAGYAVWDEQKSYWSPAPARREELKALLSEGGRGLIYPEDAEQVRYLWHFNARWNQLAPGTVPIVRDPQQVADFRACVRQATHLLGEVDEEGVTMWLDAAALERQRARRGSVSS